MRLLKTIFIIVHFTAAVAQQAEPILFTEKTYDFGEIIEAGGNAEHQFLFTNNTGRVIRILSVQASCGCTTPGWTKEPVLPGNTAFVKASFDPKGRPGYFNKSLTVTTDFDGNPISLQIRGQVVGKKTDVGPTDYPSENGSLRFKFNSFPLGKIFINRKATSKAFPVYNAGSKTVTFTGKITGPQYIKVETPKAVRPKESGTIKVTYDARSRNQFGFVSDNVEIATDDDALPLKVFSVYATIEEFFPPLSPEELTLAPVLQMELSAIDFGRIRQGNVLRREITIKNTGAKELRIKSVQGNCSCITAQVEPVRINAGEEGKLQVSLNTEGRTGIQQKAVTVYSNDPKNPVQRVTITGYIEGL
jgi:hypothetical protein